MAVTLASACRLCSVENSKMYDVFETREGLPISVMAMIICPVRIEMSDSLPKRICEDCLEIVLSAYQLRDLSMKNERFFKESLDARDFQSVIVKEEQVMESSRICFKESSDTGALDAGDYQSVVKEEQIMESNTFVEPLNLNEDLNVPPEIKYTVNCYRSSRQGSKSSLAWKYMGALCSSTGELIDADSYYCSLCVAKGVLRKCWRSSSHAVLLNHLLLAHNIGIRKNSAKVVRGTYSCDLCASTFRKKTTIEPHMISEHLNDSANPAAASHNLKGNRHWQNKNLF